MSSFRMKVRDKKTKEEHIVWAIDDYFGAHVYGYAIVGGGHYMREEQFYNLYERVEDETNV